MLYVPVMQSTLMAMPLTFYMTINALFIIGVLFIPGLPNFIEYIFPLLSWRFWPWAFSVENFTSYFGRYLSERNFNFERITL